MTYFSVDMGKKIGLIPLAMAVDPDVYALASYYILDDFKTSLMMLRFQFSGTTANGWYFEIDNLCNLDDKCTFTYGTHFEGYDNFYYSGKSKKIKNTF